MTEIKRRSMAEQLRADPASTLEMAAARGAVHAVALLNRAVESSTLTQRELAERVGVSESRVSQVLNGDGNVRMATLARFLRAAGYDLTLGAAPAERGAPPLSRREPRRGDTERAGRTRLHVSRWITSRITEDGVGPEEVVMFSRSHPKDLHDARQITVPAETGEPREGRSTQAPSASYSLEVSADA